MDVVQATNTASQRMAIAVEMLLTQLIASDKGSDDSVAIMGKNVISMIKMSGFTDKIAAQPEGESLAFAATGREWLDWVTNGGKSPPVPG